MGNTIKINLKEMGCMNVVWVRMWSSAGTYGHSIEPLGSIKGGEFVDQLSYY
jgi:hypothetical protein